MKVAKDELAAVEKAVADVAESGINELLEMQLALVGGGIGEVIVG
jgi:hypothetical protein